MKWVEVGKNRERAQRDDSKNVEGTATGIPEGIEEPLSQVFAWAKLGGNFWEGSLGGNSKLPFPRFFFPFPLFFLPRPGRAGGVCPWCWVGREEVWLR